MPPYNLNTKARAIANEIAEQAELLTPEEYGFTVIVWQKGLHLRDESELATQGRIEGVELSEVLGSTGMAFKRMSELYKEIYGNFDSL